MSFARQIAALKRRAGHAVESSLAPRPAADPDISGRPAVAGLFAAASGIGESARLCFDALAGMGFEPEAIDLSARFHQTDLDPGRFRTASQDSTGPVIIHLNPPELPRALRTIGKARLSGRKTIGYWAWELPQAPPAWIRAMKLVHEVWTPSAFCTRALTHGAPVPVKTVPHILAPPPAEAGDFSGGHDIFHVIASGDTRSSLARKNLSGSVRAFRTAFGDDPAVRLTVRLGHRTAAPDAFNTFERKLASLANVELITGVMNEDEETRFIASADTVLSLHRSEGFGLVLSKAMRLGRPVIATGWSGNMEFMTPETACLVGFRETGVIDPQGIYNDWDQVWAEPNEAEAVDWLRRLRSEPVLRKQVGDAARRQYPDALFRKILRSALDG